MRPSRRGPEERDHEVKPGRLDVAPCPDCGRPERRAFGEFVSRHGELASYAFGWTAGHDDVVARVTVGIGAGNPGGGTFHAQVRGDDDGALLYGLVDEPFETVPEGGPDLGREEALAHEALPFVWMVTDLVTDRDPRALWMRSWLLATGAVITGPVQRGEESVLLVVAPEPDEEDPDDDTWQLVGQTDADLDDMAFVHLFHYVDADPSIAEVLDLPFGGRAERWGSEEPWRRG